MGSTSQHILKMENTLQLLTDSRSISEYAREAVAAITEGQVDPLTAFVNINKIKKVVEEVGKNTEVTRTVVDYIGQRGDAREGLTVGDCKAQVCEAGITYDFSECSDPTLTELYTEADAIKERIKARENFLKGIDGHMTVIDENTGEAITLYPPSRSSKTTVKLTFKK